MFHQNRIIATSGHGDSSHVKHESPLIKFFVTGFATIVYEFAIGHYLEFAKILKQTRPESYWQITKGMIGSKGIIGIWDGFLPWGLFQAVTKGTVFGWGHAVARNNLSFLESYSNGKITQKHIEIISGGVGGGIQGLAMSPLLLLKTRVMTDTRFRKNMGFLETSKQSLVLGKDVIVNSSYFGIPGAQLFQGVVIFSFKRVCDWTTRYFFSEGAEEYWLEYKNTKNEKSKLNLTEKSICSFAGGVLSTLVTLPIDVLVAHKMAAKNAGKSVPAYRLILNEFVEGGLSGVLKFGTRGFIARVLHVSLTTVVVKTVSTAIYDVVVENKKEK